ncbi:MAG TPA: DUF4194 domain-containing protein [Nocardioidaceae bacterium]|nr:DUF4194 domain-containing protein [Nocardioidaceae bacterium]
MRTEEQTAVATTVIALMRGVVYREANETAWESLGRHGAAIRDHFATLGVDVVVDDIEGYAFLRTKTEDDGEEPLPRLVRRRALTHPQSLLLVLLRKRLVEFETTGTEGKLVLRRDQIVDELRTFLPDSATEHRIIDKVDTTIKQLAEMGFLRQLRGTTDQWEVRRILKAYVDAETLGNYATKLEEYAAGLRGDGDE